VREQLFEVPVEDGVLVGHRGGVGPPALVLHGGPAVPDSSEGLAAELGDLLSTYRYTQRGVLPSTVGGPYSIETHAADALAVLDHFGIERAWAVGHSWGGHLALHLAVASPDRLLGVIAVSPLGAFADVFPEMAENMARKLTPEQTALVEEVEERRRRDEATEEDLRERWALLWPSFFADPAAATAPPERIGRDCSRDTNASVAEHFRRGTLVEALPRVRLPALFVHGVLDPMPLSTVERTAALVPGARLATIPDCGHFPWWEKPGEVRRIVGGFLAGGHVLADAEYHVVVDAVRRWRAFALEMAQVFEADGGRADPAYQGSLRMVVLADQVLRILGQGEP
jgi:pimeloyl-ACP methyl ester carboxylesterase